MNKLIFEPQEYARLYNCNHFHIEEVAIGKRQHFYKPVLLITLATIYNILYVLCILSIYKHRANSCYKILLFMSIANVCNVCLLGYVNGYLSLVGAVFCSSPTFFVCGWLCRIM
uniref:G-protein coupled receptors family 1 profile domain-containing protein n=1 Tax=Ditylenchus dipsaci TaxID=166011 RepID=A0A915D5I0_9BILA